LKPVMPGTAEKMMHGLGIAPGSDVMQTLERGGEWGLSKPGTALQKSQSLFPRIVVKKQKDAAPAKPKPAKKKKKNGGGAIEFDQFKAVDLRVARVVAAERVAKSDRLLKLSVLAPEERTIVSGIAGSCQPEDLVGRNVVIGANLKPVKLMGILSEGMVLTAEYKDENGNDRLTLLAADQSVKPGSRIA